MHVVVIWLRKYWREECTNGSLANVDTVLFCTNDLSNYFLDFLQYFLIFFRYFPIITVYSSPRPARSRLLINCNFCLRSICSVIGAFRSSTIDLKILFEIVTLPATIPTDLSTCLGVITRSRDTLSPIICSAWEHLINHLQSIASKSRELVLESDSSVRIAANTLGWPITPVGRRCRALYRCETISSSS